MSGLTATRAIKVLALLGLAVGSYSCPAAAELAELRGIRLGEHGAGTRLVVDLSAEASGFRYSQSEDGRSVTITVGAQMKLPANAFHGQGLIIAISAREDHGSTVLTLVTDAPAMVLASAALPPNAGYGSYRIYFDLARTGAVSAKAPAKAAPAMIPLPRSATMAGESAFAEGAQPQAMSYPGEMHAMTATEEEAEPSAVAKIGGNAEWKLSHGRRALGGTAAVQKSFLHDKVEIEALVSPSWERKGPEWKSGLLVKAPIKLSPQWDLELGGGPLWVRRTDRDSKGDSVAAAGVGELVLWPGARKTIGFYVETEYSYDFTKDKRLRKEEKSSLGGSTGLLIPIN